MSDLEDRLKTWFAGEVSRAERDLASSKVRPARVRRRRPIPGLALAGLLVALVFVALAVRPSVAPDTGKGPVRSPTSGPVNSSVPVPSSARIAFGPDGIPTMLDGQKVLTPEEAAAHARSETTDRPFLVGGWYRSWATGFGCPLDSGTYTDSRILMRQDGCAFFSIDSRDRGGTDSAVALAAIEAGMALEVNAGGREWGPLVARVHIHDRRAVDCPERSRAECEAMAVIEAILWRPPNYANGIPREIAGESVVLVDKAYTPLTSPDGPQRMLVGGWYSNNPIPCPSQPGAAVSPLIPRCNGAQLSETLEPGGLTIGLVPDGRDIPRGRVVIRLHTGDPRASDCAEEDRHFCERAIVVDEVVWQSPPPSDRMAGRYPDGIPSESAGEAVFRPKDISSTPFPSGQRFLLGGWSPTLEWKPCPSAGGGLGTSCGGWSVSETPAGSGDPGTESIGLRAAQPIPSGPVVLRVRAGDPVPPDCLDDAICLYPSAAPLVEEVVWAGDDVTRTAPLDIADVLNAIRAEEDNIAGFTVEVDRPSGACDPGWPDIPWVSTAGTGVTNILVFPTIADREAVDQNFRSSGWTGATGCSVDFYGDPWHWVIVDNVMISTTDALADRTRMRLEAIVP
jgi:hypothetical protein